MEILKQVTAKAKCFNVIDSCETSDQFESAENYIKLYFNKFNDFLGFQELKMHLQEVRVSSLRPV